MNNFWNGVLATVYFLAFIVIIFGGLEIGSFSLTDQTWKKFLFGTIALIGFLIPVFNTFKG